MRKICPSQSEKSELERCKWKYSNNILKAPTIKNSPVYWAPLQARVYMRHFVCLWSWSTHLVSESLFDERAESQRSYGACLRSQTKWSTREEFGFELPSRLTDPIMAGYQQGLCDLRLGELKRDLHESQGSHSMPSEVPSSSEALCTVLVAWAGMAECWELGGGRQEESFVGKSSVQQNYVNDKWASLGTDSLQLYPTIKCSTKKPDNLVANSKHPSPNCL